MRKRLFQLCLICLAAFTMLGAGNPSTRFDQLGHKLMCPCGCAEILLECNHVGCPDSAGMITELHSQMDAGLTDTGILHWFAEKYGPTVLAAPLRGGFDLVAWVVPFAVLALGIGGIVFLMRRWHSRNALALVTDPPIAANTIDDAVRDRIRRDTTYEA